MYIDGLKGTTVDEVIMAISAVKLETEPLIVHVDDDHGERVQVFLG